MKEDNQLGVTPSEKELAKLCNKLFFSPWTCNNPFKKDKKELCDFISIFGNDVFIFFVRERFISLNSDTKKLLTDWKRWERKVINNQIITLAGAERYIKEGNTVFTDKNSREKFDVDINLDKMKIHKIIIAYGAEQACENMSQDNYNGSIAIKYEISNKNTFSAPFCLNLDKESNVHVFDSYNLSIVLNELDTIEDFCKYLKEKENAIRKYDILTYAGEEDILAIYIQNGCSLNVSEDDINCLWIGEGEWNTFRISDSYKNRYYKNKISYFWDNLISNSVTTFIPTSDFNRKVLINRDNAIKEMVKEPRFIRRELSEVMINSIEKFPKRSAKMYEKTILFSVNPNDKVYVFLQMHHNNKEITLEKKREIRTELLVDACKDALKKYKSTRCVVGISMEAPLFNRINSEDYCFIENKNKDNKQNLNSKENPIYFKSKAQKKVIYEFPQN